MRHDLQSVLALAKTLLPEELPEFLGELEHVRVTALARITTPAVERLDELLDVEETARRMNVSTNYLYHAHRTLPFARRVGRKLLFSSRGLDSYLRKR